MKVIGYKVRRAMNAHPELMCAECVETKVEVYALVRIYWKDDALISSSELWNLKCTSCELPSYKWAPR